MCLTCCMQETTYFNTYFDINYHILSKTLSLKVNFIGKPNHSNEKNDVLEISPLIITKGETTVALYAIGYMKETWFIDKWNKQKFVFIKEENHEKYFNILLIHQNNENDIISSPETAFFDLVILGSSLFGVPNVNFHEENRWHTYKPGSSIVTTYNQSEIRPKHMGLLNIRRKDFQFEPYFLKETQRELLLKEISSKELKKMQQNTDKNEVNSDKKGEFKGFLEDELEFLLEKEILQLLKVTLLM